MEMNSTSTDYWDLFPILAVKDGVIVSRRGDLTVGWEMDIPVCYSMDRDMIEGLNEKFFEAMRLLSPWMLVHRQDIYSLRSYVPEQKTSFLGRCYEEHFKGREYLTHRQYIWLTLASKASALKPTANSGIYGMNATVDRSAVSDLLRLKSEAIAFIGKITESSAVSARDLEDEEITDLMEQYRRLWDPDRMPSDIRMSPDCIEMDDTKLWSYVISESKDLSRTMFSSRPVETLSSRDSRIYTSAAAAVGPLLGCRHMVNTYFLTVEKDKAMAEIDGRKRKMLSMSKRSIENCNNAQELEEFQDSVHRDDSIVIRSHMNMMVWGMEEEKMEIQGKVSSAISSMNANAVLNTFDTPVVWYAGLPGAGCELGKENFMLMELRGALCLNIQESFEKDIPGGSIKICDRVRNIPVTLDIHERAGQLNLVNNYNAFILGESGAGKSFFTNHLARSSYDNGETVFIVDMGGSYEGLCSIVNDESKGADGHYHRWSREEPMSFDGFWDFDDWSDPNGNINQDCDGLNFIMGFIQTIAVPEGGWTERKRDIMTKILQDFTREMKARRKKPVLDDLNVFLQTVITKIESDEDEYICNSVKVTKANFDIDSIKISIGKYCTGGPYGYLLNDPNPKDIISSRFTVFDMTTITQIKDTSFQSAIILCIMNTFNAKMHRTAGFKTLIIDEAWVAIANETMAPFLNNLWKTSRKYFTSAVVVTQQLSDIMKSAVVKDSILANSSVKAILRDQGQSSIDDMTQLLGLTEQQRGQVLSMNRGKTPNLKYMEVFLSVGSRISGIYATEVSAQEAVVYQSNLETKKPFMDLSREIGAVNAVRKLTGMP